MRCDEALLLAKHTASSFKHDMSSPPHLLAECRHPTEGEFATLGNSPRLSFSTDQVPNHRVADKHS